MWIDKQAQDLTPGDQLLQCEALVTEVVPSHHGTRVFVRWTFADGESRTATVETDRVIPVWREDGPAYTPGESRLAERQRLYGLLPGEKPAN